MNHTPSFQRCTIKFSARYEKMPKEHLEETRLLAVLKVDRSQLSAPFLEWDTKFADKPGYYQLSRGSEFLVLLLLTSGRLWTTVRAAWPSEKEEYYRSLSNSRRLIMPFRILFRTPGTWEFLKGSLFDQESDVIAACIRWRHKFPDRDYGYIREESS